MKLIKLKITAKICATAALVALLAAAGTGTATALQAGTTSEDVIFTDVEADHIFSTQISVLGRRRSAAPIRRPRRQIQLR